MNWKVPTVLAAILLVALGLQASGIKILLGLGSSAPEPVAREPASAPPPAPTAPTMPTAPPISAALEVERWSTAIDPPPTADEPAMLADPPHLADLATAAQPSAPEVAPAESVRAPGPDAAALAMARLAELAEQANAAAAQPAAPPPKPAAPPPKPAAPVEPAGPATPEPIAAAPASPTEIQDADWVRSRDPGRFTVQLSSGKDLERLKQVAATIGSDEPRAYYMTGSRTSPWYSLVLGDYPNAASARAAAANLAAASALKPWVRRFGDIQSSMH